MNKCCTNCGRTVPYGRLCGACRQYHRRHGFARPFRGDGRKKQMIVRKSGHKRARANYKVIGTCEICDCALAIDRHHKDDNTANNDRSNVVFVCRRCHMLIDGRMVAWHESARRGGNKAKTHCIHGHEFTIENTYVDKDGRRSCKACNTERVRSRRLAKAIIAGETEDPRGN